MNSADRTRHSRAEASLLEDDVREQERRLWEAIGDGEKTAIKAAIAAYQGHPGTSIKVSMLKGIRAYQLEMLK